MKGGCIVHGQKIEFTYEPTSSDSDIRIKQNNGNKKFRKKMQATHKDYLDSSPQMRVVQSHCHNKRFSL